MCSGPAHAGYHALPQGCDEKISGAGVKSKQSNDGTLENIENICCQKSPNSEVCGSKSIYRRPHEGLECSIRIKGIFVLWPDLCKLTFAKLWWWPTDLPEIQTCCPVNSEPWGWNIDLKSKRTREECQHSLQTETICSPQHLHLQNRHERWIWVKYSSTRAVERWRGTCLSGTCARGGTLFRCLRWRVHGPMQLSSELLSVIHVNVVKDVLMQHICLRTNTSHSMIISTARPLTSDLML